MAGTSVRTAQLAISFVGCADVSGLAGSAKEREVMFVYWLMFFIPACFAFYFSRGKDNARDLMLRLIAVLFVFLIGLRFEVGADWFPYLYHYEDMAYSPDSIFETESKWDLGYVLFEYLSVQLGLGIYGVNLACGMVLMTGLYYFCRRQPQPFLALTIAVPYLIIAVAMGYSRQGGALGFELLALIALTDDRVRHFILWTICAALFHKSAVLIFALGVLSLKNKSIGMTVSTLILSALIGWKIINEHAESLWSDYVEQQMISDGAFIRVIMNAVAAALFLLFAKRLAPDDKERRLWNWIALFSLACIPVVSLATTAVDRMALYFLPIQLLVYSRLSFLFSSSAFRLLGIVTVIAIYGTALFVLLNYGSMITIAWIPYNNAAFFW